MRGRIIKYLLLIAVIGLVAYKSIYIKKLSEMRSAAPVDFDAVSFSKKLWDDQLPAHLDSAVSLQVLLNELKANPSVAFEKHSNALGIGNVGYCLINAAGRIQSVNEDDVIISVGNNTVKLTTEYVYGNAIRDASGLVDIRDFVNTTDLNNVSEELNKQVRENILPGFKSTVQKMDSVSFTGVIELNKEHLKLDELYIIPVRIQIITP